VLPAIQTDSSTFYRSRCNRRSFTNTLTVVNIFSAKHNIRVIYNTIYSFPSIVGTNSFIYTIVAYVPVFDSHSVSFIYHESDYCKLQRDITLRHEWFIIRPKRSCLPSLPPYNGFLYVKISKRTFIRNRRINKLPSPRHRPTLAYVSPYCIRTRHCNSHPWKFRASV